MLDHLIEQYEEILRILTLDTYAFTVTISDSDRLTPTAAINRMGLDPATLRNPGLAQPEDLDVIAVDNGIVTLDGTNPCLDRKKVTDRLAGPGFKHWYLAIDIDGNKTLYVRYGEVEGEVQFPEPLAIPFTPWTEFLGPLAPYAALLAPLYEDMEDETQPARGVSAIFLAIIESESGIRFDGALLERPRLSIPIDSDRPSM